ncbi:MAG: glycoside hydrolase, partial [Planctomycetota bacterium]
MSTQRTGIVVPHTHWDRAWYLPFQAYRLRLVEMVAELLDLLESGTLPNFVLDGQTVVLEDHLAIRPQDRPRIRTLVEAGRLRLGPWYTMPDCFLARPESLIRNLQRGIGIASEHGGASRVGYVPDSFGHFAQLPQILAGFGIDSFLFMRGMPVEVRDRDGAIFTWRAPDGSEVLATFLREGYFPLGALGQE